MKKLSGDDGVMSYGSLLKAKNEKSDEEKSASRIAPKCARVDNHGNGGAVEQASQLRAQVARVAAAREHNQSVNMLHNGTALNWEDASRRRRRRKSCCRFSTAPQPTTPRPLVPTPMKFRRSESLDRPAHLPTPT